ncbi:MAG: hypothetical protein PWQ93_366 [Clostridiales bacterium]|jgi:transcriptional regulator with XRE-family HTH domain|nr:hypothetical protein [Clostridiales bacterium]
MFGEKLKELRIKRNYTQRELAQKLNMSQSSIAMYERNQRIPDPLTLKKIAEFFNVTIDYLLDTSKETLDIEAMLDKNNIMFNGEPLTEEDKESIINFIRYVQKKYKSKSEK